MPGQGLVRRDPFFSELMDFRQSFDNLFSQFFPVGMMSPSGPRAWMPEIETFVEKNRYIIRCNLPGVEPRDVHVEVQGNMLTLSGERRSSREFHEPTGSSPNPSHSPNPSTGPGGPGMPSGPLAYREFSYGRFERTIPLPETIKTENLEASYTNGVLELSAPISEKALPRKIDVKTTPSSSRMQAA